MRIPEMTSTPTYSTILLLLLAIIIIKQVFILYAN